MNRYATEPGSAPIVDLKFSALGIDPELRESGYYRVRENLNHECTDSLRPGFLGGMRKSYLWFKQDWNMRYGFTEMNTIASKLSSFAEDCIEHKDKDDGWFVFPPVPASNPRRDTSGRRWYDTCGICMKEHSMTFKGGEEDGVLNNQCEANENGEIECKGGRTVGYMQKHESWGPDIRRQIEWFGNVKYSHENGCESLGLGKLRSVLQVKDKTSGEWIDSPERVRLSESSKEEFEEEEEEDFEDELDHTETEMWSRPLVRIHALFFPLSLHIHNN